MTSHNTHGIGIINNIPNTFYFNDPRTIFDVPEWILSEEKIKNLPKDRLVIADFSSEHYGDGTLIYEAIYDLLESNGINFILLTHNITDHLSRPRLLFYSHWYYQSYVQFKKLESIDNFEKKHRLSSLNFNHRFHRIYNYLILRKHPDFSNWVFTMNRHAFSNPERADDYMLDPEMLKEWETFSNTNEYASSYDINHPACTDSYIHLVTETTVLPMVFITEKTWKPIASGQLFLIIGNPGTIQALADLGVDTFDDIIDHKYYDHEQDWKLRIHKVHKIINDLLSQDLFKLNQLTYQRRKQNAEMLFAGEFGKKYYQDLLTCINTLN